MRAFRKISRKKAEKCQNDCLSHSIIFKKKDRNLCAVRLNPKMLFFFGKKKWYVGVSLSQFDTSFRKTEKLAKLPVFIGVESLLSVCDLRCPVIRSRRVRGEDIVKKGTITLRKLQPPLSGSKQTTLQINTHLLL